VDPSQLARLARQQSGVFTHQQARSCGFSAYQVRRRLNEGEWQRVLGSAYAFAGLQVTAWVRDRAAQLCVPGSILAGPSAARSWQLPVPLDRPYLYIGQHRGTRLRDVGLFYEDLDAREVTCFEGAATTMRPRAVIDCLRVLPHQQGSTLLDRALQQGWVRLEDLSQWVQARPAQRGTPRVLRLLRRTSAGTHSAGEERLAALLRKTGIRGWQANVPIYDEHGLIGYGDMVLQERKLVIEADGWAFHVTPERFQQDRERQNRLVTAGWTVLRFTWSDLTEKPERVIATIRATL
jgi:very-short-patch-repair endonuclease